MNALLKKWDAKKTPKEVVIVVDDEKKGTWHLELK